MLLNSNQTMLGSVAPDFSLPDTNAGNQLVSLQSRLGDAATVVMFICNHCPYVLHIQKQLISVVRSYQEKGVVFIAISSNDAIAYPADAPDKMSEIATRLGYTFPFLYDESQAIAKAYKAVCTPEFYVLSAYKKIVYHGCFDDSSPGNEIMVTGDALTMALDVIIRGETPNQMSQKPSLGCSIKWRDA